MRIIDGDSLLDNVLRHYTEQEKKGNLSFVACEIKQSFADMVNEAPTLTADDYFDAVDRIKPCPNCRYTLLGALTEDEPRWIPVTERLPELGKCHQVLCVVRHKAPEYKCGFVELLEYDARDLDNAYSIRFRCDDMEYVTHWMPLPEPPKEDEC